MMKAWEILGIEPTYNKRLVKKAYAKALAKYHPEEHPKEFEEVQNAYETIMAYLQNQNEDITYEQHEDKSEAVQIENDKQTNSSIDSIEINEELGNKNTVSNMNKIEIIEETSDKKEVDVLEIYYKRLKEKLAFRSDYNTVAMLLNSKWFYKLVENEEYYNKLYDVFVEYIKSFDNETLNLVDKAFEKIEEAYGYKDEKSVCKEVKNRIKKDINKKRKQKLISILVLIFWFILLIFRTVLRN